MGDRPAPAASVILVTRDRKEELALALDSLEGQRGSFEVIVVDDGSTDGTSEMLARRPGVVAVRRETPGGPGVARNEGARAARGRNLVFLDSDCRALDGWLEAMVEPLRRSEVGAVGGAEVLDPEEPFPGRAFHFVLTSPLTTGRIRGGSGGRAARYRPRSYSLAVRRADFERVQGFAPLSHGEDIDFVTRISGLGLELVHAPLARVHHRRRRTWLGFAGQLFRMGRARPELIRRDRKHLEAFYVLPAVGLVLAAVGVGVAALVPAARPYAAAAAAIVLGYLAVVGIAAARALRSGTAFLDAPLAFLVQQVSYGAGLLAGTRSGLACPLLIAASFALYANSLEGDFVFDDWDTFRKREMRTQSLSRLLEAYRPVRYLSYRLDELLLGTEPWCYHVFNTLYHGLSAYAVFLVLRRLAGGRVALAGALVFLAHPVQTESVAYLSGRRDVLSSLLYLLAFLCWFRFNDRQRAVGAERSLWAKLLVGWPWLVAFTALWALALGAKEMAITLPAACALYDLLFDRGLARRRWPLYAAGVALGVVGVLWILGQKATHAGWHGGSMTSNFATSSRLLVHYGGLLLLPFHVLGKYSFDLLGDHSFDAFPLSHSFGEVRVLLSLAAIALVLAAAWLNRRRAPLVTFGIGWFLVTLLPVLHIKPFHELAADHYLYLPSVGFCLLVGLGFRRLVALRRPVGWAALGLLLVAFSIRTVVRNRDWRDNETFWRVTIATAPRCARAHFNYGTIFAQRGHEVMRRASLEVPLEAKVLMTRAAVWMGRAVDLKPDYVEARVSLGRVYQNLGRKAEACAQWEEAIRLMEGMRITPCDPGVVCIYLGEAKEDRTWFERGVRICEDRIRRRERPLISMQSLMRCHERAGYLAGKQGRFVDADVEFRKALAVADRILRRSPNDQAVLKIAVELAIAVGDKERAQEFQARMRALK